MEVLAFLVPRNIRNREVGGRYGMCGFVLERCRLFGVPELRQVGLIIEHSRREPSAFCSWVECLFGYESQHDPLI